MNMKKLIAMFAIVLCAASISGCSAASPPAPQSYHKISAQQAKAHMERNQNALILDVRTEGEYAEKHIPRAILLPLQQLEKKAAAFLPDKNAEILVYCRSGNRSRQAAETLAAMGYTAVYDFGGIESWPYETAAGAFIQTEESGRDNER